MLCVATIVATVALAAVPAADGIDLDDDADVHKSAVGRSHSAVMPVLLVDGVKHHFKVDCCFIAEGLHGTVIADMVTMPWHVQVVSSAVIRPLPDMGPCSMHLWRCSTQLYITAEPARGSLL